MENFEFNIEKNIQYWIDSSEEDFETMETLYNSKRYNWSLFLGHLMIEKILKLNQREWIKTLIEA